LLAFSRIQKLTLVAVSIDELLSNAVALITHSIGPLHRLKTEFCAPNCAVTADANQLELAILNLVTNGRDAMADNGTITIKSSVMSLPDGELDLPFGDYVQISVSDEGSGIEATTLKKIFDPFFTTKPVGKGTGLGLAQVYGIVRQCGGAIRVKSEVGVGTSFELLFPLLSIIIPVAMPAPEKVLARIAEGSALKVLLVDDDENVRASLAAGLEMHGFTIFEAEDGISALQHLRSSVFDAVVIDYSMPGMNGAEVAKEAQKIDTGLPVIMITGHSDTAALDGVSDALILKKPFPFDELINALMLATTHAQTEIICRGATAAD